MFKRHICIVLPYNVTLQNNTIYKYIETFNLFEEVLFGTIISDLFIQIQTVGLKWLSFIMINIFSRKDLRFITIEFDFADIYYIIHYNICIL